MNNYNELSVTKMPVGWRLMKVDDLKSVSKYALSMGPFGSNIKAENFRPSGVPIIKGTNLNFDRFVGGDFTYLSEEKADELRSSNCHPLDLIFTHRGTIGQVGIVPEGEYKRYVVSQSGMKLTVDKEKVNSYFLFYFFKSKPGQYQLLKNESQVGVPSISTPLQSLKDVEVPIPPLSEQEAIAEILSSLDDKIDLLHRNNRTLEEMAETLFRQWFVEEAEKGWKIDIIGHHLSAVGGTTPDTSEPNNWNGSFAWTSPRDLSGSTAVFMNSTQRTITEVGLAKIGSGLLPVGTVLLSSRAPIGYLCISNIPVAINQGYIACICDKGISNWYMYCWIKDNMDVIVSSANGSTFLEISKGTFRSLEFVVPPDLKLKNFKETVEPWFEKILSNENQILLLQQLRDTLLPNLMSGEVRVKEIQA